MRGARNGNRNISSAIEATNGDSRGVVVRLGRMGWKRMKDIPTVPPTQGIGFAGAIDRDGSVSRAVCQDGRKWRSDIAGDIPDAFVIECAPG